MNRDPATLAARDLARWPPQAKSLAERYLPLLRSTPFPLLPILLREMGTYDWKFPRERMRLEGQLSWLQHLSTQERASVFAPFAELKLPGTLGAIDWIDDPASYMEHLTAALWSTGEMPRFREAATTYAAALRNAVPEHAPAMPRLCMVVLDGTLRNPAGRGATFMKLRQHGMLLTRVDPANGSATLFHRLKMRAEAGTDALAHWYVDGGAALTSHPAFTQSSYAALDPVRQQLLARARNAMSAQRSGPEELRSLMARVRPEEVGLAADANPVLAHFQLSLLTEGAGTQIFSTTFVQWAARECLRRAEPETLLACFRARQRQQGMNELLGGQPAIGLDPAGSLVDAEQAAFYTFLNLQRLPGADQARFLAWQEGSAEAILIAPGLSPGSTSSSPVTLEGALTLLT